MFLTKVLTTNKKVQKKRPPFAIFVFVHNKGFDYINLSSIFHLDIVKNLFPDKLKINEPPSVVDSLGKTIRNKILNYEETVSSIDTNDDITYGTGIVECDCQQHKDIANAGHALTGDFGIIKNSKLKKFVIPFLLIIPNYAVRFYSSAYVKCYVIIFHICLVGKIK